MVTACEVTEAAIRLYLRLRVELMPEDFYRTGGYRQVMTLILDRYTNYKTLREALPSCPADCPFGAGAGRPTGPGCFNHDLARDTVRTDATWLATHAFDTGCDRRTEAPARSMV